MYFISYYDAFSIYGKKTWIYGLNGFIQIDRFNHFSCFIIYILYGKTISETYSNIILVKSLKNHNNLIICTLKNKK